MTYLTKRQGEGVVVLGQDAKLNNPNPVSCGYHDGGPESKEWIVRYYHPPTSKSQRAAPSGNMQ